MGSEHNHSQQNAWSPSRSSAAPPLAFIPQIPVPVVMPMQQPITMMEEPARTEFGPSLSLDNSLSEGRAVLINGHEYSQLPINTAVLSDALSRISLTQLDPNELQSPYDSNELWACASPLASGKAFSSFGLPHNYGVHADLRFVQAQNNLHRNYRPGIVFSESGFPLPQGAAANPVPRSTPGFMQDITSVVDQQGELANNIRSNNLVKYPHNNVSGNGNRSLEVFNDFASQITSTKSLIGNDDNMDDMWFEGLLGMPFQELMTFRAHLEQALVLSKEEGNVWKSTQIAHALVLVQRYIIFKLNGGTTSTEGIWNANYSASRANEEVRPVNSNYKDNLLETMARINKIFAGSKDACVWNGDLPPRIYNNSNLTYSPKVFLGGLPWETSEITLLGAFYPFGIVKIEWPQKGFTSNQRTHAYAIFGNEEQVKFLLENCTTDYSKNPAGDYYYKISSVNHRSKNVQIIPWATSDSNFTRCPYSQVDPHKTVFVGGVHGMLNAECLSSIMNDLFGNVVCTGMDLDQHKYPMGSGRVTFSSTHSYQQAIMAGFVNVKSSRLPNNKFQVLPYLYTTVCSICRFQQAPFFCQDETCVAYFCRTCFHEKHSKDPFRTHYLKVLVAFGKHKPIYGVHNKRIRNSLQLDLSPPVHPSQENNFQHWRGNDQNYHWLGNSGGSSPSFQSWSETNRNPHGLARSNSANLALPSNAGSGQILGDRFHGRNVFVEQAAFNFTGSSNADYNPSMS